MLVAILIGVPLGVAAAVNPKGWVARVADIYGLSAGALPDFWLALVFIYVFYTLLGALPPPLGRIDLALIPPAQVTGMYTIDALIARDWGAFASSAAHLVLPVAAVAQTSGAVHQRLRNPEELLILEGSAHAPVYLWH